MTNVIQCQTSYLEWITCLVYTVTCLDWTNKVQTSLKTHVRPSLDEYALLELWRHRDVPVQLEGLRHASRGLDRSQQEGAESNGPFRAYCLESCLSITGALSRGVPSAYGPRAEAHGAHLHLSSFNLPCENRFAWNKYEKYVKNNVGTYTYATLFGSKISWKLLLFLM